LEHEEQLEQLRVLYNGGKIHVGMVEASDSRGVDHPDDVPVLEAVLTANYISPQS
jgi:CMP-2-keto-3-deoxyoctulosonic acid synthetase